MEYSFISSQCFGELEADWLKSLLGNWESQGIPRESILVLSSSPGIRRQAKDILDSIFGPVYGKEMNLTDDGFCLNLIRRYPELAGVKPGFQIARGPSQWVILRDLLKHLSLKSDFRDIREGRGFTREVLAFLTCLGRNGKDERSLEAAIRKTGLSHDRLADLTLIYSAFREESQSRGILALSDLASRVIPILKVAERPQALVLLGAERFSLSFLDVTLHLLSRCPRAACMGDLHMSALAKGPWGRDRLREILSVAPWKTVKGSPLAPASVLKADNPWEETRLVAGIVRGLLEEGTSAEDILILQRHASILEGLSHAFQVYGIPFDPTLCDPLRGDSMIRLIWGYLQWLSGKQESLMDWLGSPLIGLDRLALARCGYKASRVGETLEDVASSDKRVVGLLDMGKAHSQRFKEGLSLVEIIGEFLSKSGAVCRAMDVEGPLSGVKRDMALVNVGRFLEMVREMEGIRSFHGTQRILEDLEDCLFYLSLGEPMKAAVRVRDLRDAAYSPYVFLMGVSSPIIPSPMPSSPLLPRAVRRDLLRALGPIEPDSGFEPSYHGAKERVVFDSALGSASKGVFLSYSLTYPGLDGVRPSYFLEGMNEAAVPKPVFPVRLSVPVFGRALEGTPKETYEPDHSPVMFPQDFHLSASSIKSYLECPRQFFFHRLLRLDREPVPAGDLGLLVHAALKEFHEESKTMKGQNLDLLWSRFLEIITEIWERDFDPEAGALGYRCLERAREMLGPYLQREMKEEGRTLLFAEKGFSFRYGSVVLKGFIDRVDLLESGAIEVIDYKTGADTRAERSIMKDFLSDGKEDWKPRDFQLPIYYLAMCREGREPSFLSIYQLGNRSKRTKLPFKRTLEIGEQGHLNPKTLDAVMEVLDSVIREILRGIYPPTPGFWTCRICDYRLPCDREEGDQDEAAQ